MTINQKLTVFAASMVLLAMVIVGLVSNLVFNQMLTNSATTYLETATNSAQELLQSRQEQMQVAVSGADKLSAVAAAMKQGEPAVLNDQLAQAVQACPFLDFGVFLDCDGEVLSCMEQMEKTCGQFFAAALPQMQENGSVSAYMLLPVSGFFRQEYVQQQQWDIPLTDQSQTLGKLLVHYVGVPIMNGQKLCGYFLVGEVLNRNAYYPHEYSQQVVNSFLTISANTIRVCSNLPESEDHYLGTEIPAVVPEQSMETGNYFGAERAPIGENYFFRYQALYDLSGAPIGYVGVGIEESSYTNMLDVNRLIIFVVMLVLLPCIVLLSGTISKRIARPIALGSTVAKRISEGDFAVLEDQEFPENPKSEPEALLVSMKGMAQTLQKNRTEIENYIQTLGEMNKRLEQMVDARTLELSQTVKALEESNRAKSTFLANVSHELRTPLSSNISTAELLLDEIFGALNEKQKKYVKNIWFSSNHLLQLINDILDISKIDAGKLTINPEPLLVHDALEEALAVVKSLAYQKQLQFFISIVPEDLQLVADRRVLKQVLYNLLSNAIKFSNPQSRIWVRAAMEDAADFVCFSVKDEGIGIQEKDMERVFREFEQADNSYSRAYGGTGLGLPLSKKQIELHGGRIELRSVAGQGTEAIFWLPVHGEEARKDGEDFSRG